MNQLIEYKCCFCGNDGKVMYNMPGDSHVRQHVEKLVRGIGAAIACETCYKFERSRRDLGRLIMSKGARFSSLSIRDQTEMEQDFRTAISNFLHRYCKLFEDRFGLRPLFEPEMVDMVASNPNRAGSVLGRIINIARNQCEQTSNNTEKR